MVMTYQFTEPDLAQQQRLKCAFDPDELLNPGKIFPAGALVWRNLASFVSLNSLREFTGDT